MRPPEIRLPVPHNRFSIASLTLSLITLVLILLLVLFIFGVGKLPELGGLVNRGIREFRKSQSELEELAKPVEANKEVEKKAE